MPVGPSGRSAIVTRTTKGLRAGGGFGPFRRGWPGSRLSSLRGRGVWPGRLRRHAGAGVRPGAVTAMLRGRYQLSVSGLVDDFYEWRRPISITTASGAKDGGTAGAAGAGEQ